MDRLPDDIFIIIFDELEIISDKNNLSQISGFSYKLLNSKIQKYKLIYFLNNDYAAFYDTLNKYNYTLNKYRNNKTDIDFINKVIVKSFMNLPLIRSSKICSMYDLRYVFEILYKGYKLETDDIKIYNLHFYIHFYSKIMNCIDKDRSKTIENIEKNSYLFSLKQNPNFGRGSSNGWISIRK